MKHRGLIPFDWEDIKIGDRIIYQNGIMKMDLIVTGILYDEGLITQHGRVPAMYLGYVRIDRRTFWQKVRNFFNV